MFYLKLFKNHREYDAFTATTEFTIPNVSHCINEAEVHYNQLVKSFFCNLTLSNGETIELEGSGRLTSQMIRPYTETCVSAEIGELCTNIDSAFSSFSSLTSITIPNSVTSIGYGTFYNCSGLTSVTIPNSVTSIEGWVFRSCTSLTSVTIGNSVTSIGDHAFWWCKSLTSITIPNSVTSIEDYAFQHCSGLTSIYCEATTPPILGGVNTLNNTNNAPIYVPSASVEAYKAASGWSTYASRIQATPT